MTLDPSVRAKLLEGVTIESFERQDTPDGGHSETYRLNIGLTLTYFLDAAGELMHSTAIHPSLVWKVRHFFQLWREHIDEARKAADK